MKFKRLILFLFSAAFLLCAAVSFSYADELARVVDEADLLSAEEEYTLTLMIEDIQNTFSYDVVILTVNNCGGKDVVSFADDYYNYNGYGFGSNYDGMLFMIAMDSRDFYTSTCGYGISAFSDYELDRIGEAVVPYLSDALYFEAFERYLNEVYAELDYEINGSGSENNGYPSDVYDPYDDYYYDDDYYYSDSEQIGNNPSTYLIIIAVSFIIALIVVSIMKSGMRTAVKNYGAQNYVPTGGVNFTNTRDIFLYSKTSRVRRDTDNHSTGGRSSGGSSHRSSSGRSHGGRGGKF